MANNINSLLYPQLKGVRVLTAAELNAVRLSDRRTVLTPEKLAGALAKKRGSRK
ncbi:MAG: hypothetical protein NC405_07260 [Odoribacter sp.]|nr:hypothetical protein [Odoribacter sp.]